MIQEVFAFLFSAEGGDKVASTLDNINKKSETTVKQNKTLSESFMSLLTPIVSVTAAWKSFAEILDVTNRNDQLYLLSEMTGVGAKTISELGLATEQFGGNIHSASHAIMGLERNIMQLRRTGSGPLMQAGMMYGIGISTDPEKMLRNIARRMQSLPRAMKFDLGHMLGLDNATIMLLGKGVENLEKELKRAQKYTFVDEKKVEQSHELKKTISEMGYVVGGIGLDMVSVITPAVQWVVEFICDGLSYLREHKELFMIIGGLVTGIGTALLPWASIFNAVKIALLAIVSPMGILVAGLLAASLAAEDLYMYFTGGESAIGKLIEKFPELKPYIDEFGDSIKKTWDYFANGDFIKDFQTKWTEFLNWWDNTSWQEKIEDLSNTFSELSDTAEEIFDDIKTFVIQAWEDMLDSQVFKDFANYMKTEFWKDVGEVFGKVKNTVTELADALKTFLEPAIDAIKNAFSNLINILENLTLKDVLEAVKNAGSWLMDSGIGLFNAISSAFTQASNSTAAQNFQEGYKSTQYSSDLNTAMSQANADLKGAGTGAAAINNAINNNNIARNDNAVNANVEVNIYPNTLDVQNSELIGENIGRGIGVGTLGTYASGRR